MKISQNRINEIALVIANHFSEVLCLNLSLADSEKLARLVINRIDANDLFERDQEQKKYIFELQNQVLDLQNTIEHFNKVIEDLNTTLLKIYQIKLMNQ